MGLNLAALKNKQKDLDTKSSGLVAYAGKLGNEFDFRVMPPIFPEQDGVYYLERKIWWVAGKPYVSPATFGKPCPIEEEIEEAEVLAKKDKTLRRLLDNKKELKQATEYWVPVMLLDAEFDGGRPKTVKVKDDKVQILAMGSMLLKAINRIAVGRQFQNKTDFGFTDRVEGFNILGTKTGEKLDTEYSAQGWNQPYEMDEKYYTEKAIPNIVALTKKGIKSDEYLISVIRNYLYGEAIIEDTSRDDEEEETPKSRASARQEKEEDSRGRGRHAEREEEPDEEETPRRQEAPRGRAEAPRDRKAPATARNVIDDVKNGLDSLEDD